MPVCTPTSVRGSQSGTTAVCGGKGGGKGDKDKALVYLISLFGTSI